MMKKSFSELHKMKPGTKAAIYNRVSTEKLTQLEAIGHQVEESRELVLSSPLTLVEQYVETESGTSTKGRDEYKRMLKDMALGRFDVLVVKSQDRMMRNQTEWHLLKNAVRRYHKEIYFYMEDELYDTRENGLKHDVQAMLDEYESEKKSEKAAHSHERRQRSYEGQECLNITRPIFGWDRHVQLDERGHKRVFFTVNEEEAAAIREACALVEEGKGFYTIAKIMYGRNVLSKPTFGTNPQPPKRMDGNSWKKILSSPLLHGDAVMNQVKTDFYTKERIKVPREEWVVRKDVMPPILDRKYHEYILSLFHTREERNEISSGQYGKSIWTGKIVCKECGCRFYGRAMKDKKGENYRRFRCGNRFRGGECKNGILDERKLNQSIERCITENFPQEYMKKEKALKKVLLELLKKAFAKEEDTLADCKSGGAFEKNGENGRKKDTTQDLCIMQNQRLLDLYMNGGISMEEYLAGKERISSVSEERKGTEKEKEIMIPKNPLEIMEQTETAGLIRKAVLQSFLEQAVKAEVAKDGRITVYFPEKVFSGTENGEGNNFFLLETDLSFI